MTGGSSILAVSASSQASSFSTKAGCIVLAEGLDHLHHQLAPARHGLRAVPRLAPGLQPGRAGVAPAARVSSPCSARRRSRRCGPRWPSSYCLQVDLQRRADEHVAGVVPGGLAHGAIGAHRAVGAREEDVGPGADIVPPCRLRSRRNGRSRPSRPRSRESASGCGFSAQCVADLALQAERSRHRSAGAARSRRCRSRCRD